MSPSISSYWKIFRLIFLMFSLYLLGDAFFRWDGFRYYAPFIEFLPALALAMVLWSAVSALAALTAWLPLKALEFFFPRRARHTPAERWMLFICVFLLLAITLWLGKRILWEQGQTTLPVKLAALSGITAAAIFLTWLFRNKAVQWMDAVQERITPLVWLFGICFMLSVPVVAYCTWGKEADKTVVQKFPLSSAAGKNRPNIILVTFDALTALDMSVYGYERPTTPFITEWAKTASLFTKVEAASNWTPPTTSSLMTGKRVWTHRTYHEKGSKPFRISTESLPLLLKKNGYYNTAFIVNHLASVQTLGVADSFDVAPPATVFSTPVSLLEITDSLLYGLFGEKIRLYDWVIKENFILSRVLNAFSRDYSVTTVPPEKAFNSFLEIMDDNPPEPFFAWIHLFPPHFPYLPPEPFMGMFDSSPQLRTRKSQEREMWAGRTHYNQAVVGILRARYDEFIRYCDSQFENFILELQKRDRLKNSVVILSSDHGESFKRRYLRHGGEHLYEQVTHIPLIIKEPGQRMGRTINELSGQTDIPATILGLANIPVPLWMEGRSLTPLIRGQKMKPEPEFSMNLQTNPSRGHQITRGVVAIWDGDYKLIHNLKENKSLLFNLKQDPGELKNLLDREPETGQRLLFLIQDNLKKANAKIRRGD